VYGFTDVDIAFSVIPENAMTTRLFPRHSLNSIAYDALGTRLLGKPSSTYAFGGKTFHTNWRGSQRKVRPADMAWATTDMLNN
jgi:hypothetical protein